MMRRQHWLVFVPVTLATAGLAACASMLGGEQVKVRPIDTMQSLTTAPRDTLYESAVSAINERDYARALDYLQAAKTKDPRNVKALNALGVVYDKLGRFDLSARYYAQARAVEPDSKVVAENMGYSRVLQGLMNPAPPTAVASIELPAEPIASPSSAFIPPTSPAPVPEKAASVPAVPPATVVRAAAFQPEIGQVVATSVFLASPEPVALDPVPRLTVVPTFVQAEIKAATVSATSILAGSATPILAHPDAADPAPPATVMPVVLPVERKVAVPLQFAAATPVAMPVFPAIPATLEPVVLPVERKVAAPSLFAAAAPVAMPVLPAISATVEPALLPVERKVATPSLFAAAAPVAMPVFPAIPATVEPALSPMERKVAAPSLFAAAAPVAIPVFPALPATLEPAVLPAEKRVTGPSIVPRFVASATLPTLRPEIIPPVAAPAPLAAPVKKKVIIASAAPAVPAIIAPPSVAAAIKAPAAKPATVPQAKTIPAKPATAALAAVPPKPAAPVSVSRATPLTRIAAAIAASVKALPAIIAPRHAAAKPVPVKVTAVKPVPPVSLAANREGPYKKVLTIGQPVRVFNASGKSGGTGTVLRRLATLGWTMRPFETRAQTVSVLYYSAQNINAAKALQRTLPFPVRLAVENANGMRLVIGRDYLSWKPRNPRIGALWQKDAIVVSLQKPTVRGVR